MNLIITNGLKHKQNIKKIFPRNNNNRIITLEQEKCIYPKLGLKGK